MEAAAADGPVSPAFACSGCCFRRCCVPKAVFWEGAEGQVLSLAREGLSGVAFRVACAADAESGSQPKHS